MKVLITGENGYIARSLENYLMLKGIGCDLVSLRNGIDTLNFDGYSSVVHCAAIVHRNKENISSEEYDRVNYELTVRLAQRALENGADHFVFLSTMSVYGMASGVITKDTPLNPTTEYGRSKLKAENALKNIEGLKCAVVRPPLVYGKGCRGNFVTLEKLSRVSRFFPLITGKKSFIYIDNLCDGIYKIISDKKEGLFLPQNKEYSTASDIIYALREARGKKTTLLKGCGRLVMSVKIPIFIKAFGTLYYDEECRSCWGEIDFKKSIERTVEK